MRKPSNTLKTLKNFKITYLLSLLIALSTPIFAEDSASSEDYDDALPSVCLDAYNKGVEHADLAEKLGASADEVEDMRRDYLNNYTEHQLQWDYFEQNPASNTDKNRAELAQACQVELELASEAIEKLQPANHEGK